MIELDGSHLEGGGSLTRTALALSTLTQKAFHIKNIRKKRPQPGLKNQHLFCIKALQKLCNAKCEGNFLGSKELIYYPGAIRGKTIDIDIETAGSISLFLQAIILPAMFADKPVKLTVKGGTDTRWAAPIDYFKEVFLPQMRKYAEIDVQLLKRGYYPKGNGQVSLKIKPKHKLADLFHLQRIDLTQQSHLIQIKGISHASTTLQNAKVAERQATAAKAALKYECAINIRAEYHEASSIGSGITLWAIFSKNKEDIDFNNPIILGGDSLGERGKKAEQVGLEAAQNLTREINSKAPVDKYLADQILPIMALTSNSSIKTSLISDHAKANIYAIEKFLGKTFEIEETSIKTIS